MSHIAGRVYASKEHPAVEDREVVWNDPAGGRPADSDFVRTRQGPVGHPEALVAGRGTLVGPLRLEDAEQFGRIDREAAVIAPEACLPEWRARCRLCSFRSIPPCCAREAGRSVIGRADVVRALEARIRRVSRIRDRAQESIVERVAIIDAEGARVGQVNGLSVIEIGGFAFGRPTRITCRTRLGAGKVVDIEREVELGGPIHSKGVLILSGFLAKRYALDSPMSLFASLVFEQSYGGVEGDSASSAELYALLSALAEAPLRQDLWRRGARLCRRRGASRRLHGLQLAQVDLNDGAQRRRRRALR